MEPANSVFCDFVQVTVPVEAWRDVRAGIEPVLDALGCAVDQDDDGCTLWRSPAGESGTVKAKRIGAVRAIGASGAVLAGLRLAGLFGEYLARLGQAGHRVTRLDATLDRQESTAPVIERLVSAAVDPGLRLSRKRVDLRHVTRFVSRTASGEDTGTIYVGSASADVRACVYDKQQERLSRDLPDVGPLTRYELRLRSGTGVTLRDAYAPEAVFWHYASPDLLERPLGAPEWVSQGSGFDLPRAELPLPAERLRRRVEASADARALVTLARELGPSGLPFLFSQLGKLVPAGDGDRSTRTVGVSVAMSHGPLQH